MSGKAASLTEILREQAGLLGQLQELLSEHRSALMARSPERIEAAVVRLETLALRFRILEEARRRVAADLADGLELEADLPLNDLVKILNTQELSLAFNGLQEAAGDVVRAGAIATRFVQRAVEAGEGLRRLFDWAAGGSYTASGEVTAAPGPRSTWEGRA